MVDCFHNYGITLSEVIFYICYWWLISSWNQTGISRDFNVCNFCKAKSDTNTQTSLCIHVLQKF